VQFRDFDISNIFALVMPVRFYACVSFRHDDPKVFKHDDTTHLIRLPCNVRVNKILWKLVVFKSCALCIIYRISFYRLRWRWSRWNVDLSYVNFSRLEDIESFPMGLRYTLARVNFVNFHPLSYAAEYWYSFSYIDRIRLSKSSMKNWKIREVNL